MSSAKIIHPTGMESILASAREAFEAPWGSCTQEGAPVIDSSYPACAHRLPNATTAASAVVARWIQAVYRTAYE